MRLNAAPLPISTYIPTGDPSRRNLRATNSSEAAPARRCVRIAARFSRRSLPPEALRENDPQDGTEKPASYAGTRSYRRKRAEHVPAEIGCPGMGSGYLEHGAGMQNRHPFAILLVIYNSDVTRGLVNRTYYIIKRIGNDDSHLSSACKNGLN